MTKTWKCQVIADSSGEWTGNALRFATREEADLYVKDLAWRWTAVRESRVIESAEPVNYRWVNGRLVEANRPDRVTTLTATDRPDGIAVRATRSNEVHPDQKEMPLDDK